MALALGRRWMRGKPGFGAARFSLSVPGDPAAERDRGHAARISADELVTSLFAAEGASLVRLARLFTDDRDAAEDLVQEAFIRLHRSAGRIRDPGKAAPYLRSIVLNLARDHNRRGLMSLRHSGAMEPDSPQHTLEDTVVASAEGELVVEALRDLAPRQRDCLVLRYFYDLSEREIAATLGISPNSVKTHCRRGLARLADRLGAGQ